MAARATTPRLAACTVVALATLAGLGLADDKAPPDPTAPARAKMVQQHLVERGIKDPRVLQAFRDVPRHRFLPPDKRQNAYDDESIPIGEGQTSTPPFDMAFMTEAL